MVRRDGAVQHRSTGTRQADDEQGSGDLLVADLREAPQVVRNPQAGGEYIHHTPAQHLAAQGVELRLVFQRPQQYFQWLAVTVVTEIPQTVHRPGGGHYRIGIKVGVSQVSSPISPRNKPATGTTAVRTGG